MTTVLDTQLAGVVLDLLKRFRTSQDQIVRTSKTHDPITDTEVEGPIETHDVWASPAFPIEADRINGTSIRQDDFQVILAAKGITISPNPDTDLYVRAGVRFRIMAVNEYRSGDDLAALELVCRK